MIFFVYSFTNIHLALFMLTLVLGIEAISMNRRPKKIQDYVLVEEDRQNTTENM